jgi:hypothetical protein
MKDEIVDEVRRARDAYAAQFDHDLERIAQDLSRRERESGREYVNLPPKPPVPVRPVPKAG